MNRQHITLNIRYDLPDSIWHHTIPEIYEAMEGWLGFAAEDNEGDAGIPYWYSFNEKQKHICASVEPSGLLFSGLMKDNEWEQWKKQIKHIATEKLGFKIGEIELGEV